MLGMPFAAPANHFDDALKYGYRGWRGATLGVSRMVTRFTGASALNDHLIKHYALYKPMGKSLNLVGQFLGGGHGAQGQFLDWSGKAIGRFAITANEKSAAFTGLLRNITPTERILGRSISGSEIASQMRTVRHTLPSTIMSAGRQMSAWENVRTALTGRSSAIESAIRGTFHVGQIGDDAAALISRSVSRRVGLAGTMGLVVKPMLGALNVVMITQLAFKGGEALGRLGVNVTNAIRQQALAIPRLDMGGDITSFQTGLASTERQRAIQAIQGGMYNARMAIGNEAAYLHQ